MKNIKLFVVECCSSLGHSDWP